MNIKYINFNDLYTIQEYYESKSFMCKNIIIPILNEVLNTDNIKYYPYNDSINSLPRIIFDSAGQLKLIDNKIDLIRKKIIEKSFNYILKDLEYDYFIEVYCIVKETDPLIYNQYYDNNIKALISRGIYKVDFNIVQSYFNYSLKIGRMYGENPFLNYLFNSILFIDIDDEIRLCDKNRLDNIDLTMDIDKLITERMFYNIEYIYKAHERIKD